MLIEKHCKHLMERNHRCPFFLYNIKQFPTNESIDRISVLCMTSLIPAKVIGKIVLCYYDTNVRYASGAGMVLVNIVAKAKSPTCTFSLVSTSDRRRQRHDNLVRTTMNLTANILFPSTKVGSCRHMSSRPLAEGAEHGDSRHGQDLAAPP
jgi:hypothetical protein